MEDVRHSWHWNLTELFANIVSGLKMAGETYGDRVVSIGVDTWGVDYGLVDAEGRLLGLPHQYRDSRTDGMMERAFEHMPQEEMYAATGNQFMFYNTVFQLFSEKQESRVALQSAERILWVPDLLNFWLCGVQANEATIASTAQLVNAATGEWAWDVIERLGLPRKLFGDIVQPGEVLGPLYTHLRDETGLKNAQVVTVGSHDTASAVFAVPSEGSRAAYVSSGTWSLMGVETNSAVINDKSFELALTNEGGVGGTIRLLKILCGMWIVQECKRVWDEAGEEISFAEITTLASEAPAGTAYIDPDDDVFATPGDMPERVRTFCRDSGQAVPEDKGTLLRVVFESLARKYKVTWDALEELTGESLEVFHVVGGGCQNALLNQLAADSLQKPVVAGPVEATAAGNILVQAIAAGCVANHEDARNVVRRSFATERFEPRGV